MRFIDADSNTPLVEANILLQSCGHFPYHHFASRIEA